MACCWLEPLCGERLPLRNYTSEHGLASNLTSHLLLDSHGYLWIGTREGLSRFDGDRFENYGPPDGFRQNWVRTMIETRAHAFWVGIRGVGVCRFDPAAPTPARPFHCLRLGDSEADNQVNCLLEDRLGRLWAGTDTGAFVSTAEGRFAPVPGQESGSGVRSLAVDGRGSVWLGTGGLGLVRITEQGAVEFHRRRGDPLVIWSLRRDAHGRVWAGTELGLVLLDTNPPPGGSVVQEVYTLVPGTPEHVLNLDEAPDGSLWFSGEEGLGRLSQNTVSVYTRANGLVQTKISDMAHDQDGNLWLATTSHGILRLAHPGFTSFDEADGLATNRIYSLFENRAGNLCAVAGPMSRLFLSCFDGHRFETVRPNVPPWIHYFGWGHDRITFQDHLGEWWIATGQGLVRFGAVADLRSLAYVRPKAVYTTRDGLNGDGIFRLFEDSRGDIWISAAERPGLARWDRATGRICNYTQVLGNRAWASAFAEDREHGIWIAFYTGGLARYREGRFTFFRADDPPAPRLFDSFYVDAAGTLWMASLAGGLGYIEHPEAEQPVIRRLTQRDGLASNRVMCLVEDRRGSLYIGTNRGLDRLERSTGTIEHYSTADGLADDYVELAFRDRQGGLWFGSSLGGLSRLLPEAARPRPLHPVRITRVMVGGRAQPIPATGAAHVAPLTVPPGPNPIDIEFGALHLRAGDAPRYQFKLDDTTDWSAPTDQHGVLYASLGAGRHRFAVRRAGVEGAAAAPATLEFMVEAPLWQRPWFAGSVLLLIGFAVYQMHRYRLAYLLAVERVRLRIATELHDDIGSSLSQIALLTEVARKDPSGAAERLGRVADLARELLESMSDIVWAISPQWDSVNDLVSRMRRFANDVLGAREIEFSFHSGGVEEGLAAEAETRRQVYLIFKEAVHNIVRHAGCRHAAIEFGVEQGSMVLAICDDGRGFDAATEGRGNGLASMRQRAQRLSGELEIREAAGGGTAVRLRVPLRTS